MDILCGYHAKDPATCQWVLDNCDENTDNITVKLWIEACKKFLEENARTQS